jgi:hypothetical protein
VLFFSSVPKGVTPDAKALVGGLAIGERELLSLEIAENMKTHSLTWWPYQEQIWQ